MSTSASFHIRSRLRGGRQTRRTGNRRTPLPFLSRKKRKQKKVAFGDASRLFFSRVRQGVTQNGRFTYEPSVFRAGKCGKPSYLQDELSPQSLLFRFFKKERGAKESRFRRRGSAVLQQGSPRCYTKRTIHIRTVRFSCREVREAVLFARRALSAKSFVSFFQEREGSKRKSLSETRLGCSSAGFAKVLHKTDDSHTNRPFFVPGSAGSRPICKTSSLRKVFCFL